HGRLLATEGYDGYAKVWDTARWTVRQRLRTGGGTASVAFSSDGRDLVTAGRRSVRVWNVSGGQRMGTFDVHSVVEDAVFSPDGHAVAAGSDDGLVRVWSFPNR